MAYSSGAPSNLFATPPDDPASRLRPNRRGRPKGSRAKLATRFFEELYAAWEEQGESAIARAAFHDPVAFVSIVARLMPQKIEVTHPTDGMTDERLAEMLELAERMAGLKAEQARVIQADAAAPASRQVIDAPSRHAIASHNPAFENGAAVDLAREGGGGPDRGEPLRAENTSHTSPSAPAADTPQRHNNVELSSGSATPPLEPEEDIDPESLF